MIAKGLAKRIIKQSDGEISEEKALILAYRTVACMDFDNKEQMSISLESWADRIIGAYNRGGINIELYEEDDMIYAVKVKPMNNYLLLIRFNNGEERVFNCCPLLEENIYVELKDKDFFDSVYIDENGLVCWSESTDINPDYLYDNSELVSNMTFETMLNDVTEMKEK